MKPYFYTTGRIVFFGAVLGLPLLLVLFWSLGFLSLSSQALALPIYNKEIPPAVSELKLKERRDPFQRPALLDKRESGASNLSLRLNHIERGQFVVPFENGLKTIYTINPTLQHTMKEYFKKNKVPYGVFVAMNPHTGKILAMVEHSTKEPRARDLALRATYPAASIFKVITASAAIEEKQANPETLIDKMSRHRSSQTTLADAFARSDNSAFSEVALRYLDTKTLVDYAGRFQFNRKIPFELPVQVSRIRTEDSRAGLAELAAGFGDVGLSPLHAALIGSAIANDGVMVTPCLVDQVISFSGKKVFECVPKVFATVISPQTAAQLRQMMGLTITAGTARKAFRSASKEPALREIVFGGKTGSLTGTNPRGKVSWFVGMAPLENPEIVISAMVINNPQSRHWRVKSSNVAKEGFRAYFKAKKAIRS
jgi:cell division protein FtsI/penicillin-binding protein 2